MAPGNDQGDDQPVDVVTYKTLRRSRGAHRRVLRSRIAVVMDFVQITDIKELRALDAKFSLVTSKMAQIHQLDAEILLLAPDDMVDQEADEAEEYEVETADCQSHYNHLKENYQLRVAPVRDSATHSSGSAVLPKLSVPTFTGNYVEWTSFWDQFSTLVDADSHLSKTTKFSYLKLALKGSAQREISSYQTTDSNYDLAVAKLKEQYENKRCIVKAHLDELFGHPSLKRENAADLRLLLEAFNDHVRSLANLGLPTDQWDAILTHVLASKLDSESRKQWELHDPGTDIQTYSKMTKFIDNRRRALESSLGSGSSTKVSQTSNMNENYPQRNAKSSNSNPKGAYHSSSDDSCPVSGCNLKHNLRNCSSFKGLTQQARHDLVKGNRLCFNCLSRGHGIRECTSTYTCRECNDKHHTLLHRPRQQPVSSSTSTLSITGNRQTVVKSNNAEEDGVSCTVISPADVLLATIQIVPVGSEIPIRALMDSGSQCNFIRDDVARALHLSYQKNHTPIMGVGNQGSTPKSSVILDIGHGLQVHCLVVPSITKSLPAKEVDLSPYKHLSHVKLADPAFHKPGRIDLLLGMEVHDEIILGTKIRDEELFLKETLYGYVVAGPLKGQPTAGLGAYTCRTEEVLQKFWDLESVSEAKWHSAEEIACEQHYNETTVIEEDGRMKVQLPFKCERSELGSNRKSAEHRFYGLERRLDRNPAVKEQYTAFINEFIEMGHLEKVPPISTGSSTQEYFLPHHHVEKESTTTKLRVVFDASAKTTSGKSLNDCLMVGPTIQSDLFAILLSFRFHRVAISADVGKMYRQVALSEADRPFHRLFWRSSKDKPLEVYQMTRVTYGVGSSSYHSVRSLVECGRMYANDEIRHAIESMFYVDDFLGGKDSVEEANKFIDLLVAALAKGQFPLRKFSSNIPEVVRRLPPELQEAGKAFEINDHEHNIKALGIRWRPLDDVFFFTTSFKVSPEEKMTKRKLLSEIARLFDPLGWLTATIISMKILMQETWQHSLGWDEEVPEDIHQAFLSWSAVIKTLEDIVIPRCILPSTSHQSIQLHLFCDASERAYAACVYSVVVMESRENVSNLLVAKSKVAPTKTVSLPRLELCAMHLGAKLLQKVIKSLDTVLKMNIKETYAWTDSTVALAWVKAEPRRWCTFVANRCADIQARIPFTAWSHVSTNCNPADLGSRGVRPSDILPETDLGQLWWHGPQLLRTGEIPPQAVFETDEEAKKERKVVLTATKEVVQNPLMDLSKYSSLSRVLRVLAFCRRIFSKLGIGPITLVERRSALMSLVASEQSIYYQEEIMEMKANEQVGRKSSIANLYPFLDKLDQSVIRVGGRLARAKLHVETRFPLLIPRHSRLALLITEEAHVNTLHGTAQVMMGQIRQKFWIIRGIELVKKVIRNCIQCARFTVQPVEQLMGDLPSYRVNIPLKAFTHTGLDFAGPFTIRDRKGTMKAYACLFVCLASKAVHIELAADMSSSSCLAAIKRFTARRGLPQLLLSDNGSNFIGVKNELSKVGSKLSIEWRLIPPASPHFGGLWEAGVKCMKHHLRRVMGQHNLSHEELSTLLCQIEQVLNSRPLCAVSDSPDDMFALTPAHLCSGHPLEFFPEVTLKKVSDSEILAENNPKARWIFIRNLLNAFWQRWSKEYVTGLQQRKKWKREEASIKKGDIVFISDDNQPPLHWPLGRVIQAYAGHDNYVRVAKVKTATATLTRPITKLRKLPIVESLGDSRPGECSGEQNSSFIQN